VSAALPRRPQDLDVAFVHDRGEWITSPSSASTQRCPRAFFLIAGGHQPGDDPAALGDGDRLTALADAIDQRQTLRLELGGGVFKVIHVTSLYDQTYQVNVVFARLLFFSPGLTRILRDGYHLYSSHSGVRRSPDNSDRACGDP
jgi:hypothetical protein